MKYLLLSLAFLFSCNSPSAPSKQLLPEPGAPQPVEITQDFIRCPGEMDDDSKWPKLDLANESTQDDLADLNELGGHSHGEHKHDQ